MSILSEYEKLKYDIGEKKYDAIEKYLNIICPEESLKLYYSELAKVSYDPFEEWNKKRIEIKEKYNIVFLEDILYKPNEWAKFDIWYNEQFNRINLKILSSFKDDDGDFNYNVLIYKNDKLIANEIIDFSYIYIRKFESEEIAVKCGVYMNFEYYANKPKISKCSKLLQTIYDVVCESEVSMCHITEEDWNEEYKDIFSEVDIEKLKNDVEKYNLKDVITFDDGGYKILGYSNLQRMFNDDRKIERDKDYER